MAPSSGTMAPARPTARGIARQMQEKTEGRRMTRAATIPATNTAAVTTATGDSTGDSTTTVRARRAEYPRNTQRNTRRTKRSRLRSRLRAQVQRTKRLVASAEPKRRRSLQAVACRSSLCPSSGGCAGADRDRSHLDSTHQQYTIERVCTQPAQLAPISARPNRAVPLQVEHARSQMPARLLHGLAEY